MLLDVPHNPPTVLGARLLESDLQCVGEVDEVDWVSFKDPHTWFSLVMCDQLHHNLRLRLSLQGSTRHLGEVRDMQVCHGR